jgi:hypothetical protein
MISAELDTLIRSESERSGVDANLLRALAEQESGGIQWKTRYELQSSRYVTATWEYASRLGITSETERTAQMHSYGVWQMMGFLAREMGYQDYLIKLCDPTVLLPLVCKHLKHLAQHYPDEPSVISAYNQGSPRKTPGGQFENASSYVDPVCRRLRELRSLS